MDVKKNLIILIFVLSSTLASLLVLNFQKLEKDRRAQILNAEQTSRNFPIRISRGMVNSFGLRDGSGKVIFYEENDSIIYEAGLDAKNKAELVRIPNVSEIIFSPNGDKVAAAISEKSTLKNFLFDLRNNTRTELPKNIDGAIFSPDGKKIAYRFYNQVGQGNISIIDLSNSETETIFNTRIKNLKLSWPEPDLILLYSGKGDPLAAFSITPDGQIFQKLSEEELNRYLKEDLEKTDTLEDLGIEGIDAKLSPLKDYLIFINAKDRKLYSLKI